MQTIASNANNYSKIHAGLKLATILARVKRYTMGHVTINTQTLQVLAWDFITGSYRQAGTYTTKENLVYILLHIVHDFKLGQTAHYEARRAALRKQGLNI